MKPHRKAPRPVANAGTHAVFPQTCWTEVVFLKKDGAETEISAALGGLCEAYWFPLYAFARHRGMSSHDAEDAVQGFFLTTADADYFKKADRSKGKLRTFLLTGFTRHLKDVRVRNAALKRGGGAPVISLDAEQAEEWLHIDRESENGAPTLTFEREWARSTMRAATEQLRVQHAKTAESEKRFDILSRFLNPAGSQETTYKQAADELGISEEACSKAIQRLRTDFRLTVREQVASTLDKPDEESIMEEMRQLQQSLVGG